MEWLEKLNCAVDYIEKNLEGEIKYEKAAQIACCSTYHFQRMFSYIAGVHISEYIRRRRLTRAALDLQSGDKVLEVALRYGYESPTAFNRAFQNIHGITPSAAQKEGISLKAYPRISFKITVKGVSEMEFRIENKGKFRIVGLKTALANSIEQNFKEVPQFWQKVSQNGDLAKIAALINREPFGVLGVSACLESLKQWEYYIAAPSDAEVPLGMEEYIVPACTWAIFPGESDSPKAIQELEKRIVTEWLPSSGYEYANAPDVEVYLSPDPSHPKYEVWLPIVKK
ncbi:AraC family transcriptional regulator [Clostridium oryzae]|uniref:Transposon Tn10 TetD protein n=1 Tax=Clostridium oryzae TaxID=1450648 RepID=A0A1V4I5H5_9CLOT|nr:AraC family transcriptional regulator [Clostridium oryzae]OPJ55193.1 transposon Tn10 TetD protein [Clostridium oryzae]